MATSKLTGLTIAFRANVQLSCLTWLPELLTKTSQIGTEISLESVKIFQLFFAETRSTSRNERSRQRQSPFIEKRICNITISLRNQTTTLKSHFSGLPESLLGNWLADLLGTQTWNLLLLLPLLHLKLLLLLKIFKTWKMIWKQRKINHCQLKTVIWFIHI